MPQSLSHELVIPTLVIRYTNDGISLSINKTQSRHAVACVLLEGAVKEGGIGGMTAFADVEEGFRIILAGEEEELSRCEGPGLREVLGGPPTPSAHAGA